MTDEIQRTHFADDATLERLLLLERVYEIAQKVADEYPYNSHLYFDLRGAVNAVQQLGAFTNRGQGAEMNTDQARIRRLTAENKDLRLRLHGIHGLAVSVVIDCELPPGVIPDDERTGLAD